VYTSSLASELGAGFGDVLPEPLLLPEPLEGA
jgi:hypothetical protein